MAATEPPSSGEVGWLELLSQHIIGNCDFRLRWTEPSGAKRELLLTHNDHDDRVVIYSSVKPDGAAFRTPQHGFWRWHNSGGTLVLQAGYSKKGTSAGYILVISMTPHQSAPQVLQDKHFRFEASLATVEPATDVHSDTQADWVMSEMSAATTL